MRHILHARIRLYIVVLFTDIETGPLFVNTFAVNMSSLLEDDNLLEYCAV
jgi:hypothetical protein